MSPKYQRKRNYGTAFTAAVARGAYKRFMGTGTTNKYSSSTKAKTKRRGASKTKSSVAYKKPSGFTPRNQPGPVFQDQYSFTHRIKKTYLQKGMKAVNRPSDYSINENAVVNCAAGVQAHTDSTAEYKFSLWSYKDINAIFTQAKLITEDGKTVKNIKSQRVLLQKVNYELMITNQTNDVGVVTIYFCQPRRDLIDGNFETPHLAWYNGVGDITVAGTGSATPTYIVGTTPFQSSAFTELFNVQKVHKIDIHSGGHYRLEGWSRPNLVMGYETLANVGTNGAFRNLTSFFMVVVHGMPADGGSASTTITTSPIKLDIIVAKTYKYRVFERSSQIMQVDDNMGAVVATITNDLTGATGVTVANS